MKSYDIVIIGGGVVGLTAAYSLSKEKLKVLVLEKEKEVGGALRSHKTNGSYIEESYHHIFENSYDFINLLKELGINDKLIWGQPITTFLYKNKLYKLSSVFDFLKSPFLSLLDKFNLGLLMINIKLVKNFKKLDNIPAEKWIIKKGGKKIYKKLFLPLLKSKFGSNYNQISASWFVDRMQVRNNRKSKSELLGYLKGGFHYFIEALYKGIINNKGTIETNVKLKKITVKNNKITSLHYNNKKVSTKLVISTMHPAGLLSFLKFPEGYAEKIQQLEPQGNICILLSLKRKLTDYYWINILDQNIFGSLIEHTNYIPSSEYGGQNLFYLASYPNKNSKLWGLNDNQLFKQYFNALIKIFPTLKKDDVLWWKINKLKDSGLIYKRGILKNMLPIRTPYSNLFIGGMFNSYPDRSINKSVSIGDKCAKLVKENYDG
ncbi:MAG: FAD-dependent oxidoreductase [Nanoarchaeota archaeon]|nr:FAD-dependent oxidoreductase [Nanoarchaeota archaeon]